MKDTVVIYHANCYDGVTAAWVCHEYFGGAVDCLPMNYSDSPPDVTDKHVVMVDFSFKRNIILEMRSKAKSMIILDHHQTAQKELEGLDFTVFDMNRSGAGLAWDYFFIHSPRPSLVNYIEDRDLWRFKLPDSREINAWIQSFDIDLNVWIEQVGPLAAAMDNLEMGLIVSQGESLLRQQTKYVKSICHNAKLRRIGKYMAPYVQTSILMSEACEQMLKDFPEYPFAFYSFERKDGKIQYGLRSRNTEDFDVSVIAKEYGGGGHKHAAGFELDGEYHEI